MCEIWSTVGRYGVTPLGKELLNLADEDWPPKSQCSHSVRTRGLNLINHENVEFLLVGHKLQPKLVL